MPDEETQPDLEEEAPAASAPAVRKRGGKKDRKSGPKTVSGEIKRTNIAVNVAVQLICALLLFLIINYLASRHYGRHDLSANKKYTVSENTTAYLERLDTDVEITMAFVSSSKIRNQLGALLEQFEHLGGGKLKYTEFDPVRDKDRALALSDRYDMSIDQNAVFVDVGGKVKKITEVSMMEGDGRMFAGESAIISAMLAATDGRPKTVYLIAGKGKLRNFKGRTALEELIDLSERHFFELKELTMGNIARIPDDADALILINPETDFAPNEVTLLTDYWENQRGSMVLLLNPSTPMTNLYQFLRKRGVWVRNDHRVLFSQVLGIGGAQTVYSVQSKFLEGSPVTAGKVGAITTFGEQTAPLQVAEDNEDLANKGVVARALLEADPKFWGDRNHTEQTPKFDQGADIAPAVYVAASIERGGSEDEFVRLDSSRLVVVGNPTLLDPDHLTRVNAEFVMNSINWTLDRDERIDIMPKPAVNYRSDISARKYRTLFWLVVFILPGAAFCFGLFVWSTRRN